MTTEPTPLDLDAIRERAALLDGRGYGHTADRLLRSDVPRLVAEVRSMTGEILRTHERLAEAQAEVDRLNRVSDLNPFGADIGDACCIDAYGSTGRDHPQVLHTSGCRNRCSVHTPTPAGNAIRAYPCALTAGHLEDHWVHPMYREPPRDRARPPSPRHHPPPARTPRGKTMTNTAYREAAIAAAKAAYDDACSASGDRVRAAYRAYRAASDQGERDVAIAKGEYAQALTEIDRDLAEPAS